MIVIEGLEEVIRRRRETIMRLVEERGRAREQEPERAGQIDAEVELELEAIGGEIRSLRSQLIPVKEGTMSEEQRVIEARKEEIKHLEKKTGNIKKTLEKRPGDESLTARLGKLEDRQAELQRLNDNGIVTARTPLRRLNSDRPRYF